MFKLVPAGTVEKEDPVEPGGAYRWNYMGRVESMERGPQAFLLDWPYPGVIEPHFHEGDQFQIFTQGDFALGKSELGPVTVFYTDGYTPYGPIKWGEDGMRFFNLRARANVGAYWMPGSGDDLRRRAGRRRTAVVDVIDPAAAAGVERADVIELEDDGLYACSTIAGPGEELPREPAGGAGRYELVLAGTMLVDGREAPPDSVLFASTGDLLPARTAGSEGVQVLTVQAPSE
jgi:hypothetical protein